MLEKHTSYFATAADHSAGGTNLVIHETGDVVFARKYLPAGVRCLCSIVHLADPEKNWRPFAIVESVLYDDIA